MNHFASRPFLITFSGIDGAGKTTQIENVTTFIKEQGLRVSRFTFWDDAAVWSKMRAEVGSRTTSSKQAANGTQFSTKNNKHVRKWWLSLARSAMYMLDAAKLQRLLARQAGKTDVIIFDRYIYDQIANLYSQSAAGRFYARFLLKQVPAPDVSFIVDASPEKAFARKPEYPLEFVKRNRQTFLNLRELVSQLIVIPEGTPEAVKAEILGHLSRSRISTRNSPDRPTEGKAEVRLGKTVEFT